ncbi:hypothetical protein ACTMU2_38070 [Cupriavidus basilensis]
MPATGCSILERDLPPGRGVYGPDVREPAQRPASPTRASLEYRFETGGLNAGGQPAVGWRDRGRPGIAPGASTAQPLLPSVRDHAWCQAQGPGERIPRAAADRQGARRRARRHLLEAHRQGRARTPFTRWPASSGCRPRGGRCSSCSAQALPRHPASPRATSAVSTTSSVREPFTASLP